MTDQSPPRRTSIPPPLAMEEALERQRHTRQYSEARLGKRMRRMEAYLNGEEFPEEEPTGVRPRVTLPDYIPAAAHVPPTEESRPPSQSRPAGGYHRHHVPSAPDTSYPPPSADVVTPVSPMLPVPPPVPALSRRPLTPPPLPRDVPRPSSLPPTPPLPPRRKP